MKNENFNQKPFLDKLGLDISQDNYEESIQRLLILQSGAMKYQNGFYLLTVVSFIQRV